MRTLDDVRGALILGLSVALAGCASQERTPALAPVKLAVDAPTDESSVESDSVEVTGEVVPRDARVLVAGAEADVRGGSFRATVALDAGVNVIDVQAGAQRRPAAMTAVRVTRLVPVEVPDVEGLEPGAAIDALEAVGLRAELRDAGGLLDELLPGDPSVCATSPDAGEQVRVGTTVVLATARSC